MHAREMTNLRSIDLPATQLLSSSPSIRSIIKADEVKATAKKKTILKKNWNVKFSILYTSINE